MRGNSSLRKQTTLVRVPLLTFLYVAKALERVLGVAFGNKLRWFESHDRHIFYVAQAVECVLAVAFGNKLRWFESHCWHISLCSQGTGTRASSSLWKQTMLVWVPLSAYFFMYPYDWKHLLMGIVGHASTMGVLWTQGGFALALFEVWGGNEMRDCWKMCSSNFTFRNKFTIVLSCSLLVDSNTF